MKTVIFIPNSLREAAGELRFAFGVSVERLPVEKFVRAWSSLAYLFPGLHPDSFEEKDSGWPRALRHFAAEAWRRAEAGELPEEVLYPSDAQWCGLYDRMTSHTPEEREHRALLR